MNAEKTICNTPTPGKKPTSIPTWKFTAVRAAILDVVPLEGPGVAAKDLPGLVARRLSKDVRDRLGSVSWHTTTVKLQMEVAGELRRLDNKSPQHLLRC